MTTTLAKARGALRLGCHRAAARLHCAVAREPERGDVPGWVLITLMTAGLVTALWALAGPQLNSIFTNALASVKGP